MSSLISQMGIMPSMTTGMDAAAASMVQFQRDSQQSLVDHKLNRSEQDAVTLKQMKASAEKLREIANASVAAGFFSFATTVASSLLSFAGSMGSAGDAVTKGTDAGTSAAGQSMAGMGEAAGAATGQSFAGLGSAASSASEAASSAAGAAAGKVAEQALLSSKLLQTASTVIGGLNAINPFEKYAKDLETQKAEIDIKVKQAEIRSQNSSDGINEYHRLIESVAQARTRYLESRNESERNSVK